MTLDDAVQVSCGEAKGTQTQESPVSDIAPLGLDKWEPTVVWARSGWGGTRPAVARVFDSQQSANTAPCPEGLIDHIWALPLEDAFVKARENGYPALALYDAAMNELARWYVR